MNRSSDIAKAGVGLLATFFIFSCQINSRSPIKPIPSPTADSSPFASPATVLKYPKINALWIVPGIGMEFAPIKPGKFTMGNGAIKRNEKPAHPVYISAPFWIGIYEVTQTQYAALMNENPSYFQGSRRPVENVSWDDANEFCRRLSDHEINVSRVPAGYVYRLPTEAEWEYCCHSGNYAVPVNRNQLHYEDDAWFDKNSNGETHVVGQLQPNDWGIYDMQGNVMEWCWDRYDSYETLPSIEIDPRGPDHGDYRVVRGGGWHIMDFECRCATRDGNFPEDIGGNLGFRVVLAPR